MVQKIEQWQSCDGKIWLYEKHAADHEAELRIIKAENSSMRAEAVTITEDHIALLKQMNVSWSHCEYGAPSIDPKRPYGNGGVACDIHRILTGENKSFDQLTDEQEKSCRKIHVEMKQVLQVCLSRGAIEVGQFAQADHGLWGKIV